MVSWSLFENACKANPTKRGVAAIHCGEALAPLDHVPYPTLLSIPVLKPTVPVASVAPVVPVVPVVPVAPMVSVAPVAPIVAKPLGETKKKQQQQQQQPVDPLRIAMEYRDPMYSMAGATQRIAMECEEAQRLEAALPVLYKSQGGRSRGWTLSGLDPMLKPRCATGTEPNALRNAKAVFDWNLDDKGSSAFFDFVCVAQQIRVAIWTPATKTVTLYPAADQLQTGSLPLYHLNEGGFLRQDTMDGPALIKYAEANGWTLAPPSSVLKVLGHLTLTELDSVGKQLGAPDFTDLKKAERIAVLGAFKVKQRLLS